MSKIWFYIFEFFEVMYKFTGLRWQRPIEFIFPDFCPWLFNKMMGKYKHKKIDKDKE